MPLCFAFGSNMDRAAMAARCPNSHPLGVARLPDHRFAIGQQGWATVVPERGSDVWGVLWSLAELDVAPLDRYEAVASGLYRKCRRAVILGRQRLDSLVYIINGPANGVPRSGYMAGVIAAASANGLPPAYVRALDGAWRRPHVSMSARHRSFVRSH